MKKTSSIILTLVASVSITLGSAVTSQAQETNPPQYLYDTEKAFSDSTRTDTVRTDTVRRDTVVNNYYGQNYVYYNYYYRSYFWDGMYRFWFPRRYFRAINRQGYVPRHLRTAHLDAQTARGSHPARGTTSGRRGGFGHSGISHSATA